MSESLFVSGINPKETNIGLITKIALWPGGIRPAEGALNAQHAAKLQDNKLDGAQQQRKFWLGVDGINKIAEYTLSGIIGAVKKVVTYTLAGVVENDTAVVGRDTFTFKNSPVAATDVQVGVDDDASATNLANKITARTGTTLATATASGAVVTATANTAGVAFTHTGSANITATQTVANQAGSSCVVGGDTYTFIAVPVAATDVALGADDDESAANLAAKITARSGTSLATATSENNVVTATSATLGVTFNSSGDANITVNVTQAATAGTGARRDLAFGGNVFVPKTRNIEGWSMKIANKPDVLFVSFPTPSGLTNPTTAKVALATGMKANYTSALAGTAPTTGEVFSLFGASRAEIKAALEGLVGTVADDAFTLPSSGTMRITLKASLGASGNNYQTRVALLATPPNFDFDFTLDGHIDIANIGTGIQPGVCKGFKFNENPGVGTVDGDDFLVDFVNSIIGLKGEGEITLTQSESAHWQAIFAGGTNLTFNESYDFAMYGGNPDLETWGMVVEQPSKKTKGQKNLRVLYEVQFVGGLQQALDKAGAGLPIKFTTQGADTADPHGFSAFFREFVE